VVSFRMFCQGGYFGWTWKSAPTSSRLSSVCARGVCGVRALPNGRQVARPYGNRWLRFCRGEFCSSVWGVFVKASALAWR